MGACSGKIFGKCVLWEELVREKDINHSQQDGEAGTGREARVPAECGR